MALEYFELADMREDAAIYIAVGAAVVLVAAIVFSGMAAAAAFYRRSSSGDGDWESTSPARWRTA